MAAIAVLVAGVRNWRRIEEGITIRSDNPPAFTLDATIDGQSYLWSAADNEHSLTIQSRNYPFSVWPRLDWQLETSDGKVHYVLKDLALGWDPDEQTLGTGQHGGSNRGTDYAVQEFPFCRIVKHWSNSRSSDRSCSTQTIHLYCVDNQTDRILAEWRGNLVVRVNVIQAAK